MKEIAKMWVQEIYFTQNVKLMHNVQRRAYQSYFCCNAESTQFMMKWKTKILFWKWVGSLKVSFKAVFHFSHFKGKHGNIVSLFSIQNIHKILLWCGWIGKQAFLWLMRCWILVIVKKYKTFSVLIYSYINTSGNWKNEKLCGNTTPAGRSVFTQFWVFPIFTSVDITVYQYGKNVLYFFYNIAQRTLTEEWQEIFCVDIELYQHGS